jgi:hypothetical protein
MTTPESDRARRRQHRPYRVRLTTLLVLTGALSVWALSAAPPRVDGLRYFSTAYNVAVEGVYSNQMPGEGELVPDNRWEPLYPIVLAPGVALAAAVTGEDLACFLEGDAPCSQWHRWLKLPNVLSLLGLVAATAWVARGLLGSETAALASAAIVGLLYLYPSYVDSYFAEILAALLVTLHAGFLAETVRQQHRSFGYAVASAGALGLAVLTNAVFLYWIPIAAVCLFAALVRPRRGIRGEARQVIAVGVVFLVVALAVPAPWVARNVATVPDASAWQLRSGGGGILSKRVELASMSRVEYAAAWVYWSTPTYGPRLASAWLPEESYRRLVRAEEDSFYQVVRRGEGRVPRGDTGAAVRLYVDELGRQALLTPLVAYRGTVPWAQFNFTGQPGWLAPLRVAQELLFRLMILAVPAMVWSAFRAGRRDASLLWAPAVFSIGFHATITHYLPRYSVPIGALAAIAIVASAMAVWEGVRRRHRVSER